MGQGLTELSLKGENGRLKQELEKKNVAIKCRSSTKKRQASEANDQSPKAKRKKIGSPVMTPPFTAPKAKQMLRLEMNDGEVKGDIEMAVEKVEILTAEVGCQIVFFCETKLVPKQMKIKSEKLNFENCFVVGKEGMGGGLAML